MYFNNFCDIIDVFEGIGLDVLVVEVGVFVGIFVVESGFVGIFVVVVGVVVLSKIIMLGIFNLESIVGYK